jgi:hypothetical protein
MAQDKGGNNSVTGHLLIRMSARQFLNSSVTCGYNDDISVLTNYHQKTIPSERPPLIGEVSANFGG